MELLAKELCVQQAMKYREERWSKECINISCVLRWLYLITGSIAVLQSGELEIGNDSWPGITSWVGLEQGQQDLGERMVDKMVNVEPPAADFTAGGRH